MSLHRYKRITGDLTMIFLKKRSISTAPNSRTVASEPRGSAVYRKRITNVKFGILDDSKSVLMIKDDNENDGDSERGLERT